MGTLSEHGLSGRIDPVATAQPAPVRGVLWRDGTTHIRMSPLEFMQRLAALVPRPRPYLIRFHGVLAPNARLRAAIVPGPAQNTSVPADEPAHDAPSPGDLELAFCGDWDMLVLPCLNGVHASWHFFWRRDLGIVP